MRGLLLGHRTPSYIPARTFAMTLLDVLGYAQVNGRAESPGGARADANNDDQGGDDEGGTGRFADRVRARWEGRLDTTTSVPGLVELLRKNATGDVVTFLSDANVQRYLGGGALPEQTRTRLVEALTGAQTEWERLNGSVEVWFNNAMDRVSGAYKRRTQAILFWIGMVMAFALNADTVDLWRRLSSNEKLREGLATQAAATWKQMAELQTAPADTNARGAGGQGSSGAATGSQGGASQQRQGASDESQLARGLDSARTANQDSAAALYRAALAELEKTQLRLGWTGEDAAKLGIVKADTVKRGNPAAGAGARTNPPEIRYSLKAPWSWQWFTSAFLLKLLGVTLTGLALSLGAPFWFDMLNKIINIRGAGRAPQERPVSPDAPGKRPAEIPPK